MRATSESKLSIMIESLQKDTHNVLAFLRDNPDALNDDTVCNKLYNIVDVLSEYAPQSNCTYKNELEK